MLRRGVWSGAPGEGKEVLFRVLGFGGFASERAMGWTAFTEVGSQEGYAEGWVKCLVGTRCVTGPPHDTGGGKGPR